ncbi:MAG: CoB--CoM heterodisulfide reductase iron-sulfur subunit B family protein [Thermodesulfobacteriota bacterium]
MPLRYAYYPGCASQEVTKEANDSTRKVAEALGIELVDMPKANCCGAGLMTDYDRELWLSLNARIFAQAEEMGMDIMTICSTCLMVMNSANHALTTDPAQLKKTNALLAKAGIKYEGNIKITQLLWVLAEDFGLNNLRAKVTRPLSRLKVAPFYGCHSLRPSEVLGVDDPEKPHTLDDVIRALGADTVSYSGKTKCCGFQVDLVAEETAVEMTGKRLLDAKERGSDCMVTPCPFCHINLDSYQGLAEKQASQKIDVPIFHLSQLVGVAIGLTEGDLGLSRNMVSPERLIRT